MFGVQELYGWVRLRVHVQSETANPNGIAIMRLYDEHIESLVDLETKTSAHKLHMTSEVVNYGVRLFPWKPGGHR